MTAQDFKALILESVELHRAMALAFTKWPMLEPSLAVSAKRVADQLERAGGAMLEHPIRQLERLAEWFDNPAESLSVGVSVNGRTCTPGFLLRAIVSAYGRAAVNQSTALRGE